MVWWRKSHRDDVPSRENVPARSPVSTSSVTKHTNTVWPSVSLPPTQRQKRGAAASSHHASLLKDVKALPSKPEFLTEVTNQRSLNEVVVVKVSECGE